MLEVLEQSHGWRSLSIAEPEPHKTGRQTGRQTDIMQLATVAGAMSFQSSRGLEHEHTLQYCIRP